MNDFLIDDMTAHYFASKNRDYRQRVIDRFEAFIRFLQENRLTSRTIHDFSTELPTNTKIMRSDLTEEGCAVVLRAYDKWLKAMNTKRPPTDVTILQNALRTIRDDSN